MKVGQEIKLSITAGGIRSKKVPFPINLFFGKAFSL
jgi:hypothetical protein